MADQATSEAISRRARELAEAAPPLTEAQRTKLGPLLRARRPLTTR